MISNVCYLIFNFLNLQAGWIHRIDRKNWKRPYRCPTPLLAAASGLGFVNLAFMGAGADVWGEGTLRNGLIASLLIVPLYLYRHHIQDGGVFPADADALDRAHGTAKRAGFLPDLAIIAAAGVIFVSHHFSAPPGG